MTYILIIWFTASGAYVPTVAGRFNLKETCQHTLKQWEAEPYRKGICLEFKKETI